MPDDPTRQAATTRRLPRARLAPVGGRGGAGVASWIAGGALALGVAWLGYNALRPIAGAEPLDARTPQGAQRAPSMARSLDDRQRDLDALVDAANLFAPDRAAWPALAEAPPASADPDEATNIASADAPQSAAQPPAPADAASRPIDAIPISTDAPAAVTQRLRALSLVGIYGVGDRHTAVIRDSTLPPAAGQTRHYRAGDTVGAEQWDLLAVDARRDRVILHRAGHNLELRMYPETIAMAAGEAPASVAPTDAGPATPEAVRRDLEAAGVPDADIEELLRLATGDESLDGEASPTPPSVAEGAAPPARDAGPARAMPAELSALLRAMARDAAGRRAGDDKAPTPDERASEAGEGEGEGG